MSRFIPNGRPGSNQNVTQAEMVKIRSLADFDLVMLISEIHDHGWVTARQTLKWMPPISQVEGCSVEGRQPHGK